MRKTFGKRPTLTHFLSSLAAWGFLCGCMAGGTDMDGFPRPIGPKIIPLENGGFTATFRYAEFDTGGAVVQRLDSLALTVRPRANGLYGYAFEAERENQGLLLAWHGSDSTLSSRDSAGIYLAGTFRDSVDFLDSVESLWLPQLPVQAASWDRDGHPTEVVSTETEYFAETSLPTKGPSLHGFQRFTTVLVRESAGDTLTHYHFVRGLGCLGFERTLRGRLLAAGTMIGFEAIPAGE